MSLEILAIISPLSIVFGAVILMIMSSFEKISIKALSVASMLVLSIALVFNLFIANELFSINLVPEYLNNIFVADTFSTLLSILMILGVMATIILGQPYFEKNSFLVAEFFPLLLFALFGMIMLAMSSELITIFVALEIASISIYILVGLNKKHQRGSEALFKYLMLGSFSGAFFLFGAVLIYAFAGTTHLSELAEFIQNNQDGNLSLLVVGGTLIMINILFKIAAFPFHSWSLDVYNGAPMPVTAFMASTFKVAILAVALRIFIVDFSLVADIWDEFLIALAIITLVGGSLLTLSQTSVKRMLISSSIVHSGYLMIAIASTGAMHNEAAPSIIFYLISYFLTAVGAFGLLSYIAIDDNKRIYFEDFKGFSKEHPILSASMAVFMLSFAGFPSTIGFLGKFYIFMGAIEAGYAYLAVFGVLAAFVSIYYYFKVISMIYFYPSNLSKQPAKRNHGFGLSPFLIAVLAAAVLWGGIGNMLITFLPGATVFIDMAKLSIESLMLVRH